MFAWAALACFKAYTHGPYPANADQIKLKVFADLPLGSTRRQVEAWLPSNGVDYAWSPADGNEAGWMEGTTTHYNWLTADGGSATLKFRFDRDGKLDYEEMAFNYKRR